MNDVLVGYTVTLAFVCVLGALFCVYRYYLGNKLIDQSNKLKSQIAKIRQDFPNLEHNRSEIVAGALGDIGIDGLLDELGIPKAFKPLAQGFIDKIAANPEIIKGFAEKLGVKLPNADDTKGEKIDLL